METAKTIYTLKNKWRELSEDKNIFLSIVYECKRHISEGGGVLWLKYENKEDNYPTFTWIPKGSSVWNNISNYVSNFGKLTEDYDPYKHYLIYLSVPHNENKSYGQMLKMEYK